MPSTSAYGLPYADTTSVPDIGYWGQQIAEATALNLGARPYFSGARPAHANGKLIYETDTGRLMISYGGAWLALARRASWITLGISSDFTKSTGSNFLNALILDSASTDLQAAGTVSSGTVQLPVGVYDMSFQLTVGPAAGQPNGEFTAYLAGTSAGQFGSTRTISSYGPQAQTVSVRKIVNLTVGQYVGVWINNAAGGIFLPNQTAALTIRRLED